MTERQTQLKTAIRALLPRVRLDADMTDRALALTLLSALRIDPAAFVTSNGQRLHERSDAYVIEFALARAEIECAQRADVADDSPAATFRANARRLAGKLAELGREPLLNARPAPNSKLRPWERPLPNDPRRRR